MTDVVKEFVLPLDASNTSPAVVTKHSLDILAHLLHTQS